MQNSEEDTNSNEDYDQCIDQSPKSIFRDRYKIKKIFKPIYKNLGLEPLVIEDPFAAKMLNNEKLKKLDPLARAVVGRDDDDGNALKLPQKLFTPKEERKLNYEAYKKCLNKIDYSMINLDRSLGNRNSLLTKSIRKGTDLSSNFSNADSKPGSRNLAARFNIRFKTHYNQQQSNL